MQQADSCVELRLWNLRLYKVIMSYFDSYTGRLEENSPTALIIGVLLAIALQIAFYIGAARFQFEIYEPPRAELTPLRAFSVERFEVDSSVFEDSGETVRPPAKPLNEILEVHLPAERIGEETLPMEIIAAPAITPLESPQEQAASRAQEQRALTEAASQASESTLRQLEDSLRESTRQAMAAAAAPAGAPQPLLDPAELGRFAPNARQIEMTSSRSGADGSLPGFSNLDQLLRQSSPIQRGTAPILMPTDLLFDYNRFELRPDAVESLRKLGTLIQRNPQANFLIEGHTDSFGPEDYNLWLSQRRAEAVKQWLVSAAGIDSARIATRGLGKSRLIVPGDRSVEEQQLNRRVEIVIRTR